MLFLLFVWMTLQRRCKWIIKIDILPKPASLWKLLCSKRPFITHALLLLSQLQMSLLSLKDFENSIEILSGKKYMYMFAFEPQLWDRENVIFLPNSCLCVCVCVLLKKLCNYVSARKILFKMYLFSSPAENISGTGDRRINLSVSEWLIRRWWEDWQFIS